MEEIVNKFWAIGGGKGGVGKSLVTVLLGAALARMNKKVVLVDADLGGSNLHTLVGIRYPTYTLVDFLKKNVSSLEETLLDTPVEGMKIICGADDILGVANPKHTQKARIFNHLKNLEADFILIDLGAGTSFTTIDFFLFAPNRMVVLTPQVTSLQNAYGFIKSCLYRELSREFGKAPEVLDLLQRAGNPSPGEALDSMDKIHHVLMDLDPEKAERQKKILDHFTIRVVINMVKDPKEKNIHRIIASVARHYLNIELEDFGTIPYDRHLDAGVNQMASLLQGDRNGSYRYPFYELALLVTKKQKTAPAPVPPLWLNDEAQPPTPSW
jgi:flagellar biosynthesis protein FlhG